MLYNLVTVPSQHPVTIGTEEETTVDHVHISCLVISVAFRFQVI